VLLLGSHASPFLRLHDVEVKGDPMRELESERGRPDGSVSAAVSNAVVRLVREYTGRGPTRSRAHISGDLVSVVMADGLTKAERNLVDDGKGDLVLGIRKEFQRTMREDLIAAVEMITERKVIAFMSDNHIDPDMAIEAFVLEPGPTVD
jgi:uncharacterized protein YbcI